MNSKNPSTTANSVGGLFFPLALWIGVEPDSRLSPRQMQKAIHAAVSASSFENASEDLLQLAEVDVSAKRLGLLVARIGNERIHQLAQQTADYRTMPLPQRKTCPIELAPQVACVQADGGRMQIRDRKTTIDKDASDGSPSSFWKETKAATLLKMTSKRHDADPCPKIPETFVDPVRMQRLTREIKGYSAQKTDPHAVAEEPLEVAPSAVTSNPAELVSADQLHALTRPEVVLRSVLASTSDIHEFGKQVVAAAYARGFHAAPRRAFVGDGMACNWTLQEKHFSDYTPILDFVHALCYVYHAAMAGRSVSQGQEDYCQWAQWLWGGQIDLLLEALGQRQAVLGSPGAEEAESSPRNQLASATGYLQNQKRRMNYPAYRQEGLPITSAYIESTIKQLNRRVKGTEKFWSINADAILQLRADHLSETEPMKKFWQTRRQHLPISTYYNMAN